jgi:CRISPR system Cascade subunit CasD
MAAWGDIAVGEIRGSWSRPSKSAVLGLIAGALGHPRTDETALVALDRGLGFAVRLDGGERRARPFRDYHTTQSAVSRRNQRLLTRREELASDDLATVLSERSYLANAVWTIALWAFGPKAPALDNIKQALLHPHFTLYLGRKACPLARPLGPHVLITDNLRSAFASYDAASAEAENCLPPQLRGEGSSGAKPAPIWFEMGAGISEETQEETSRRDALRQRRDWTFRDRREGLLRDAESG